MLRPSDLGYEAVKMLSAVIDRQFAKDKTFLASWRSAKRVVAKPGVVRGGAAAVPAGTSVPGSSASAQVAQPATMPATAPSA